ncbi:hypothetical protein CDV55_101642 [Aspergillus turcosus]|uniref:3-keto-alpha-glucoside-1,2-lyase/3-keto-2-hydroxy-glucal hydratase domain-containing protein n=1 Tax=Aspergillus turcosus TaxID=1245748 RepID=A0A229WXX4_9EURO|nr:hypothetical protein CDV55_101642 [Aspergillus turcosus]RLL96266.1 hypothetical protein CFD26_103499 [Aspergillus turcosus]
MAAALNSPVYIDYGEFFMNSSNILAVPYENVTAAFKTPVAIHSTAIDGFDWTQPYPGSRTGGHTAYLEIAQEMPLPASIVEDATTVLSSLTFGIPDNMSSGGQPLVMDPSWYICRHVFISTRPEAKLAVDGGSKCNFLSQACQADLKTSLTQDWGKAAADGTMCSALGFDAIPPSCQDSFGFARQDVMAFDAAFLANAALAPAQTSKEQQQYSWRIGTGYHDPGDARAYALAANRTYLVATVWGYSQSARSRQVPEVSFGCLSAGAANNVAFGDDFSSGSTTQWKTYGGSFDASSNALVGSKSPGGKALVTTNFANFLFEADVTLASASGNAGLLFRASNPGIGADAYNGYYAGIAASGSVVLGRASNSWTRLGSSPADVAANKVHHVRVQAMHKALSLFVDDMSKAKVSVTDGAYTSGMNGVRVYDTGATFDNIRITPLAFSDDFASGTMGKWTTVDGEYQVSSSAAVVSASPIAKALITDVTSKDLIYEADVSIDSSANGNGGFIFRVSNAKAGPDSYNGYYAGIGNGLVVLGRADNKWNGLKTLQAADIKAGQKHHLMIRTRGDSISVFVDDLNTPRMVVKDGTYSAGLSGIRAYKTTMSVSNVRIYTA